MKANKGFTLIELLAVIVILAIIALIATPIIIGVIDDAREKSAENSAYGIIDAARLAYTESLMSTPSLSFGKPYQASELSVSGAGATAGTYTISEDGEIKLTGVVIGEYTCAGNTKGVSCSKTGAGK